MSEFLAIANCRVSSDEQLKNNSLKRQRESIFAAADKLEVEIPSDGWWSGSVSSKRGSNLKRKDIVEMLAYCKKHPKIKYLIVDEPDRFMRSIDEAIYLEMEFKLLNVRVWYACDDELNNDDMSAKLMKFMKYFVAEGSNEERQRKSIAGQVSALMNGRYPFSPKPGYRKGYVSGVQEVDELRGPALRRILIDIAIGNMTPSHALVALNKSDFTRNNSQYKMDKFRKIITDPFYAGIVEIDKQVKFRNENGLHEPLITKEQHEELVRIMTVKKKNQSGPRKNGNPLFPLNNIVSCSLCIDKSNGRYVGFKHDNGKNHKRVYEKYKCRGCGRYVSREELHARVKGCIDSMEISQKGSSDLVDALNVVWKQREGQAAQDTVRMQHTIKTLSDGIRRQVDAAIDPSNAAIKDDILLSIAKKKVEVEGLESQVSQLNASSTSDRDRFLRFALNFVTNMSDDFFDISHDNRLRCKQLIFPSGFYVDGKNKVYTPEISLLYRLAGKKKDTEVSEKSLLVRVKRL